jgi:hypothetical protein
MFEFMVYGNGEQRLLVSPSPMSPLPFQEDTE